MVKDLETKLSSHTTNNAYREIFDEFYDFSNAGIYKIVDTRHPSGIIINGLLPNIHFTNMNIANIWEGGLRIQNKPLSLNEADEKPHLIYDKTTKKLKLKTNGLRAGSTNETSIT